MTQSLPDMVIATGGSRPAADAAQPEQAPRRTRRQTAAVLARRPDVRGLLASGI